MQEQPSIIVRFKENDTKPILDYSMIAKQHTRSK
jgi:hypothetical protein